MLCECVIQYQLVVFLWFIDNTKAFDKVQHEKFLNLLQNIGADGDILMYSIITKDIQLVRNLYWNQKAAIRIDELSDRISIFAMFKTDAFNIYIEVILRDIRDVPGIQVGGVNINYTRYADDSSIGSIRR